MSRALKRIWAALTAVALVLTATGCGIGARQDATDQDESLQKVLDAGQLVLGLDAEYPPMGFRDASGEIVGFDIDVAREVCDRLGIKLVMRPINWDAKEDELNGGTIDCIWNGMSVTPARAASMCLSEPYMKNELIFVVTESSTAQNTRDLKGMRVGVQSGSTTQEALEASELYPDITVVPLPDNLTLFQQLREGAVDAALVDSIVAYYFLFSSDERYFVLDNSLSEDSYECPTCGKPFMAYGNKNRKYCSHAVILLHDDCLGVERVPGVNDFTDCFKLHPNLGLMITGLFMGVSAIAFVGLLDHLLP